MFEVFTAFGLSAAAGLNVYLPLLVVGLLARYTDLITLSGAVGCAGESLGFGRAGCVTDHRDDGGQDPGGRYGQ